MDVWLAGFACGLAAVFVIGLGLGLVLGRTGPKPPRITYYGRGQQTGADLRRRLFGGPYD